MRRQCLTVRSALQILSSHMTAELCHCAVCSTERAEPDDRSTVSLSCLLYRPCWVTRLQFCLTVLSALQTLLNHVNAVLSYCAVWSTDLAETYDCSTVSLCCLLYRLCWGMRPQYCLIVLSALQTLLSHMTAELSHCAVSSTYLVEPCDPNTVSLCCLQYGPCWTMRTQYCLIVLSALQTSLSYSTAVLSHCAVCSTDFAEACDSRTVSLCCQLYRPCWAMRPQHCIPVLSALHTLQSHTTAVVSLCCLLYRHGWVIRLQYCLIVLSALQNLLSHMTAVLSHCAVCSTDLVEPYGRRTVSLCCQLHIPCWAMRRQYCLIVLSALQILLSHMTAELCHCAVCSTDLVEPYGRRTVSLCCLLYIPCWAMRRQYCLIVLSAIQTLLRHDRSTVCLRCQIRARTKWLSSPITKGKLNSKNAADRKWNCCIMFHLLVVFAWIERFFKSSLTFA
jgi:hypothetical protein